MQSHKHEYHSANEKDATHLQIEVLFMVQFEVEFSQVGVPRRKLDYLLLPSAFFVD